MFLVIIISTFIAPSSAYAGKRDCSANQLAALQKAATSLRVEWSSNLTRDSFAAYQQARNAAVEYAANCRSALGVDPARVSQAIDARQAGVWQESDVILANVDLAISKTASVISLNAGEAISYEISVTNLSANPANAVVVSDTFPAEVEMTNVTPGSPTCFLATVPNTLSCALGVIAAGATSTIQVSGQVYPSAFADGVATITNTASVVTSDTDTNSGNNSASVTTWIDESADLAMYIISNSGDVIRAGQDFDLTLMVENLGPSYARNVRISEQMFSTPCSPTACNQFQVVSIVEDPDRTDSCTALPVATTLTNSSTISCALTTTLEPINNSTIPAPVPNSGRWTVIAKYRAVEDTTVSAISRAFTQTSGTGGTGTPDPNLSNNETTQIINAISVADLQAFSVFGAEVQTNGLPGNIFNSNVITPMPDPTCCNFGGTTVTSGRRIQWDTTALNAGPSPAENAFIEVFLPYGATVIENTLTGLPSPAGVPGRCMTEAAGELRSKVICEYGTLNVGQQGSLRFIVLVDSSVPLGTQLSFDSSARSETLDSNLSNNITSIQFDANNFADLALAKTAEGPLPWRAGETRTYKVVITNKGPSYARDAKLIDTLPVGMDFVSAVMTVEGQPGVETVPCAATSNNVLDCPLGNIPPTPAAGPKPTVYITVRIDADVPNGTLLINTATVQSDSSEPFLADNTATANVTISEVLHVDLEITKSAPATATVGEVITYTIDVTNLGNSTAHNVKVLDFITAGLQLLTITPQQGNCNAGTAGDPLRPATCNLGNIAGGATLQITITARINSFLADAVVFNDVQVSCDEVDGNGSNNIFTVSTGICGMTVTPSVLPNGQLNVLYDETISTIGGTAPLTFAVTSGTLPSGLALDANTGQITGLPDTGEIANFTITATDFNGCTASQDYTVEIAVCVFCDDFEDNVLAPDWTYLPANWSENGGNLVGTPTGKKTIAIATPVFAGCSLCAVETSMSTAGGFANKLWLYAWYQDKDNLLEVIMAEETGRWILKHRVNGVIVNKTKGFAVINTNTFYDVKVTYNGSSFVLEVDGSPVANMSAPAGVTGTVGFQVKGTTGSFGEILVQ